MCPRVLQWPSMTWRPPLPGWVTDYNTGSLWLIGYDQIGWILLEF